MLPATVWMTVGAVGGLLTVAFGAFGAHGLKGRVDPALLANWQTAADYLGLHALALLACGLTLLQRPDAGLVNWAGWAFVLGISLFSGSLFAMTLTGLRQLGAITPIGGVLLLIAWALLAIGAARLAQSAT